MPPIIAAIICVIGIWGLFHLNGDKNVRTSYALWLPAVWLFLINSRPLSRWLGGEGIAYAVDVTQAYVEGNPVDRAAETAMLLAGLTVIMVRAERVGPLLRRNALIFLFFGYCAASILWSDFPFVAFKRWTKSLGDVVMILIIMTESKPLLALKRLVTRLGFFIFPLSILFFKYYPNIGRRLTLSWTMECTGVAIQKNQLGADCMIYGVFFLWMLRSVYRQREDPGRRRRLVAYGTIIAMIIYLLYYCNSMTSITGLTMAGGVMLLTGRRSRKPVVVHLLVLAVLAISLTAMFFNPGGDLVAGLGRDRTFSGRTLIWSLALGLHTNPWVGTGFESFWLGRRLVEMREALPNFPINQAHNAYLEVYLQLGWAGLTLLALLLLTGYIRVMAAFRRRPEIGALLLGLFLATLFESLTEDAFRMMTLPWINLLLVIIAAAQARFFGIARWTGGQIGNIAAAENPVYATPGASFSHRLSEVEHESIAGRDVLLDK